MQCMLLIYNDPAREPAFGTPAFDQMMGGFFALNERMKADVVMRGAKPCRASRLPSPCASKRARQM
jgi:hypothetical protein